MFSDEKLEKNYYLGVFASGKLWSYFKQFKSKISEYSWVSNYISNTCKTTKRKIPKKIIKVYKYDYNKIVFQIKLKNYTRCLCIRIVMPLISGGNSTQIQPKNLEMGFTVTAWRPGPRSPWTSSSPPSPSSSSL